MRSQWVAVGEVRVTKIEVGTPAHPNPLHKAPAGRVGGDCERHDLVNVEICRRPSR